MAQYPVLDLVHTIKAHLLIFIKQERIAELEAWWILEALTNQEKALLIAEQTITLSPQQELTLKQWIEQRIQQKKPLQYILGTVPFCNLTILVEPPILIPRPETEEMIAWLIARITQNSIKQLDILDLCTGTGCIGLALAAAFPAAQITGIDNNPQAIALAEKNKQQAHLSNITFLLSNLYEALDQHKKFDIIVSNPPYLSQRCYEHVSDEIRLWEDTNALVANHDGMLFYEKIISQAHNYLKEHTPAQKNLPSLVLEIGIDQDSVEQVLANADFKNISIHRDMQGLRRWACASI